ncbi:MAG: hypothetical protein IPH58_02750 [Sphingobacteriales bacterium]|nr:hypothetical protein [Sphingobacteriales bacterium]
MAFGLPFCFDAFVCSSNQSSEEYILQFGKIDSIKPNLKTGDLVVRNGTDDISRAARSFNRVDTGFSHCGIVILESDTAFVYHALGGIYNSSQNLMRQPIDSFCNPKQNDKVAFFRYGMNEGQINNLKNVVRKHFEHKLLFDMFFNFDTDDRMYCSEFVFKSLNAAMSGALTQILHTEKEPVFVSIDDLYLSRFAQPIKEIDFTR